MSVVSMAVGATTPDGATFAVVVDTGPNIRVAVADNETMSDPVFTTSQAVDAQGAAKVAISGLDPSTGYWWQVEDNGTLDTSKTGRFTTHPPAGSNASFTFGVSGDAGLDPQFPGVAGTELSADRVSNHPVFGTLRQRALDEGWLFFAHMGDIHYYNLGDDFTDTLTNRRRSFDDVLAQPLQAALYRDVPTTYVWDDHDYGPNDSDGTLATKANAAQVYRERWPHYPLSDSGGIWQSFEVGRVLFVMSDTRYYRSPNTDPDGASKTMLGAAQKTWLDGVLASSDAKLLVWLMPTPWIIPSSDAWSNFATERQEIADLLAERGWLGRMCMVSADRHALGLDTGGSNDWGAFPILHAASLDATHGEAIPNLFDYGPDTPGRNQYGTVTVTDLGTHISVTLTGWQGTSLWKSYQFTVAADQPATASGAFIRTLSGSHRAVFDARVVTGFQTGDDPDGETIPILGGDVLLNGSADIRGTLALDTDGEGMWPRRGGEQLLAPFGNEIFVRRGVDLGSSIEWVPLGYYRISTPEQDDAPDGPIRISGFDRMRQIVRGRLLEPRTYQPEQTVGEVVADLVLEIYPDAVIAFDDDSDQQQIGRVIEVEEDRYAALLDIVLSLGKIHYWDGIGVYRIETAPELTTPVWEIHEGSDGVLVGAGRSLTDEEVYNAVVAIGEGAGGDTPVRAVAVDNGPQSATRFGGRFGRVPRFYRSPLIITEAQAQTAAAAMLRRSIGFPYSVNFQSIVNPRLKPFDVVRIDTGDGREMHTLDTVRIPLTEDQPMSASTREQSLIVVEVG